LNAIADGIGEQPSTIPCAALPALVHVMYDTRYRELKA